MILEKEGQYIPYVENGKITRRANQCHGVMVIFLCVCNTTQTQATSSGEFLRKDFIERDVILSVHKATTQIERHR